MALKVSVSISGIKDVKKLFKRVNDKNRAEVIRVVNATAQRIRSSALLRSPVDTGRLRSSIAVQKFQGGMASVIGSNVEYAAFVEFGTKRNRAQPYLVPSLKEHTPRFIADLRNAVKKAKKK